MTTIVTVIWMQKHWRTGMYNNKFGISFTHARRIIAERHTHFPFLKISGVGCHIGSQIRDITPIRDALHLLCRFMVDLQNEYDDIQFDHIDVGGGLGVDYGRFPSTVSVWQQTTGRLINVYVEMICKIIGQYTPLDSCRVLCEPGIFPSFFYSHHFTLSSWVMPYWCIISPYTLYYGVNITTL